MRAVIEMPTYIASAKRVGMTDAEGDAIVDFLARNPTAGAVIPGTGGARKLRWRSEGRGKSGGYRVITWWGGEAMPVFLLSVYHKSQQSDLSGAGRNALKSMVALLAQGYRERNRP